VLAEAEAPGQGGDLPVIVIERAARIVEYTLDCWRAMGEQGGFALSHRDAVLDQGVARLLEWLESRPERSADRRTLQRCRVAGVRTAEDLDALLDRWDATFPGTTNWQTPAGGGPRRRTVRAPARVVVTTGDNGTRAQTTSQRNAG
jgi:hypothetical protein